MCLPWGSEIIHTRAVGHSQASAPFYQVPSIYLIFLKTSVLIGCGILSSHTSVNFRKALGTVRRSLSSSSPWKDILAQFLCWLRCCMLWEIFVRLTRSPGSSYLPPTGTSRRPSSRCRCCLLLLSVPCMSEIPAGVGETTVSLSTVCGSHPLWIHRVELAFSGCRSDSPLCSLLLCWALFCVLHEILVGHRLTRSQCPHPSPFFVSERIKNALSLGSPAAVGVGVL